MSSIDSDSSSASFHAMVASGTATLVFASALAYVLLDKKKRQKEAELAMPVANEVKFDKSEFPGGQIVVYYATQTGTSESLARQIEREGPDHGFFVHVVDLEDIEVEDLVAEQRLDADTQKSRAIFLTATYGEGEAPDNAQVFAESLRKNAGTELLFNDSTEFSAPELDLSQLEYCVFGLGNRQYDHYNAMGKFFDHALERTGSKRVAPLGLGNDDDDLEADFENWKDKQMWPALKKAYLPEGTVLKKAKTFNGVSLKLPDCPYVVEFVDKATKPDRIAEDQIHSSSRHYFSAVDCPVSTVRELRSPEDGGSTMHVEIDISKAKGLEYTTADNLGVLPVNDPAVVESVAKILNYDLDAVFRLKAAPSHDWHGAPFPMPISVRECLSRYCDLTGAPRRSELKLLAAYATDPLDRQALSRMSSKEGKVEYHEKIVDQYVGISDLLKLCPSISMPLEHFLNVCNSLQTRFFTISSSSTVHPKSIHLTVAVTQHTRKNGSLFHGVCSNYLASRSNGTVRIFNRPSTFRLPSDTSKPIIMIGPGSGVAPMRAILQEQAYRRQLGKDVGRSILYFGCKTATQDFLYKEEMEAFQRAGDLHSFYVAFSRAQEEKVYVQHLLKQNAVDTWKLVDQDGAYIFVCGGVKMGHDVAETLKEIAAEQGELSEAAAKDYFAKLSQNGRYVQELWA